MPVANSIPQPYRVVTIKNVFRQWHMSAVGKLPAMENHCSTGTDESLPIHHTKEKSWLDLNQDTILLCTLCVYDFFKAVSQVLFLYYPYIFLWRKSG